MRVTTEDWVALWLALDAEAPLVRDSELRNRLAAAAAVAFTSSYGDLEDERSLAYLVAFQLMRQARFSVEAYLRGDQLPPWTDLPNAANAQVLDYQRDSLQEDVTLVPLCADISLTRARPAMISACRPVRTGWRNSTSHDYTPLV